MAVKNRNAAAERSHYLNVTLENPEEKNREEVVISLAEIMRQFKRFFLPWFLISVIVAGLIAGIFILVDASPASPVTALVSFSYPGIENGKNPDGTEFQADKLKAPEVIKTALTECDLDESLLEAVRHGIVINPIIPSDALDRITTYAYLYENAQSGSLTAAEKMMEVSWYSTQYQLKFNYGGTGLNRDQAAQLLNTMTSSAFRSYFIREFGYNNALGNALKGIDYSGYDYAEAVELMDDSLSRLRTYINNLASTDSVRFRSNKTGYTFADLRAFVDTYREIDLDQISSYITFNNVTKDKDRLQAYYEYKIENLGRQKIVYEETLETMKESIDNYQKDSIFVFANDINTQSTTASDQYDKMIADRIKTQTELSQATQRIEYYNQRLAVLRKSTVGTTDKVAKVQTDLNATAEKITNLIELVEQTADDYFENYSLTDAYSVLVPASYSAKEIIISGIKDAFKLVFALELVLFAAYFAVAFISALVIASRNRKNQLIAAEKAAAAESCDDAAEEETSAPAEESDTDGKTEKHDKNGKRK